MSKEGIMMRILVTIVAIFAVQCAGSNGKKSEKNAPKPQAEVQSGSAPAPAPALAEPTDGEPAAPANRQNEENPPPQTGDTANDSPVETNPPVVASPPSSSEPPVVPSPIEPPVETPATTTPLDPNALQPTTESIQQQLINVSCVGCHTRPNARNRFVGLRDIGVLVTYPSAGRDPISVGDAVERHDLVIAGCPEQSMLLQAIASGDMPPGGAEDRIGAADVEVVRQWIRNLAKSPADRCPDDEPRD
jgi:hypothetical protein